MRSFRSSNGPKPPETVQKTFRITAIRRRYIKPSWLTRRGRERLVVEPVADEEIISGLWAGRNALEAEIRSELDRSLDLEVEVTLEDLRPEQSVGATFRFALEAAARL